MFLLRVRGAFFFWLWVRPCPGLGRSGGIQLGVGRPALLRVRGAFFFCCGCAASSLTHLLPAASENPLQKGIQGPRRVYFFAAGARALGERVYFFCCGCVRVRGTFVVFAVGARQVHSLTCCRPPPNIHCRKTSRVRGAFVFVFAGVRALGGGRVYFFAAGARRVFFVGCGCAASSLTHSLPAARRAPTAKKHTQQKKKITGSRDLHPKL